MATVLLGVLGAGIGAFLGGPEGAQLGLGAGMMLAGVLFPPKQKVQYRGKLDDVRVTGSGYGAIIPQIWGKMRVGGNLIWSTKLQQTSTEQTQGGKGGLNDGVKVVNYHYSASFAVAVCRGPITAIKRIWAEDVIIYDDSRVPNTKYNVTIYTGSETQVADPIIESYKGAGQVPAFRGMAYVVFQDLPLRKWANRIPAFTFEVDAGAATVGGILSDVFQQTGLQVGQFDVTGATAPVTGMFSQDRVAAADVVAPLCQAFAVDLSEYDGIIHAVPRGGAVDMAIDPNDTGTDFFDITSQPLTSVTVKRLQDAELPFSVEVTYYCSTKDYETGNQRSVRFGKVTTADALTVTLPLVLTDDQARQIAEMLLYAQWIEREQITVQLPPRYARLVPASVVTLLVAGQTVRMRVVGLDYAALFGPIQLQCVKEDIGILSQTILGGSLGTNDDSLVNPDTLLFVPFCANGLNGADVNAPGYYLAAAGGDDWEGVQVYFSRDGSAFKSVKFLPDSVLYATTLTSLANGKTSGDVDYVNTLNIRVVAGTPETVSLGEMLGGKNAMLVGNEVIQYLTATPINPTDWTLSGLRRGLRGTDYAWSGHGVGENCIGLTPGTVKRVDVNRDLIGKSISFKAITDRQKLPDVAPISLTITGQELKPYSPAFIRGSRDISGNLTITWQRRNRGDDGEWADGGDIDLDQLYEQYKVEVYNGVTLVRTITGLTTPTASYTAAQQSTDFGTPQTAVSIKVYQLGDFIAGTTTPRQTGYPGSAVV